MARTGSARTAKLSHLVDASLLFITRAIRERISAGVSKSSNASRDNRAASKSSRVASETTFRNSASRQWPEKFTCLSAARAYEALAFAIEAMASCCASSGSLSPNLSRTITATSGVSSDAAHARHDRDLGIGEPQRQSAVGNE